MRSSSPIRVPRSGRAPAGPIPSATSTRHRILFETSNLIAERGYHGTSTREIARAVGIRQPSLFHHFPSKDAIVQDLLSFDLDEAVPFAEAMAASPGEPSVRLYRYLRRDLLHLIGSPYNLSGLYTEEIMAQPAFAPWARKRDRLHRAIERIVRQGVERGEFVDMPPRLVREAITGILIRTLTLFSGRRVEAEAGVPDQIASFVLRAILADPSELQRVRERAGSVADLAGARP
ncbi:MAG TPA: TetR/AcrR family transcriptional regulator [Actinomycetota bacterium]|nr:TetR/AcrR family transcriptional regulator [Actinomycetota bacterium]